MAEVRKNLKPKGILTLNLSLPTDYLSQQATNLATSIFKTINQEFKNVLFLLSGLLAGAIFPLVTQRFLKKQEEIRKSLRR